MELVTNSASPDDVYVRTFFFFFGKSRETKISLHTNMSRVSISFPSSPAMNESHSTLTSCLLKQHIMPSLAECWF
jgi:hypothetical protein